MDFAAPKFVNHLRTEIKEELNNINSRNSPLLLDKQLFIDRVLKVYRLYFDKLIERLVTYKVLLIPIRDAYNQAIAIRDERIKIYITQQRVFGYVEHEAKADEKTNCLLRENFILKDENTELKSQCDKYKQDMHQLRREMYSDHMSLMEERHYRYMLFFENVNLHLKVKELDGSNDYVDTSQRDPVILKIALDRCREQLSSTMFELKIMKEDYANYVPRNTFEKLEASKMELTKSFNKLQMEYVDLQEKHTKLEGDYSLLKEDLLDVKEKYSELERIGTPRPEWELCSDFVRGGTERWRHLAAELTSRDILKVILKELGPAADVQQLEYFEGLGFDPVIPAYLQYDGKVQNLRWSRRELSVLLNDIWKGKIQFGGDISMQDYVARYFNERYDSSSARAEWAYNLFSSCQQRLDDPQVKVFWGTLGGTLSADIYLAHLAQWNGLKEHIRRQAKDSDLIAPEDFEKAAKNYFPLKTEMDIRSIIEAARRQLKIKTTSVKFEIEKLFQENEEGFDRTELAMELLRQRQAAQEKYIKEIIHELGGKKNMNKMISVDNLKRAFVVIDPHIDHIQLEKNIRWAFADNMSDLKMLYPLPLKTLVAKLATGNIERAGPRYRSRYRGKKTS